MPPGRRPAPCERFAWHRGIAVSNSASSTSGSTFAGRSFSTGSSLESPLGFCGLARKKPPHSAVDPAPRSINLQRSLQNGNVGRSSNFSICIFLEQIGQVSFSIGQSLFEAGAVFAGSLLAEPVESADFESAAGFAGSLDDLSAWAAFL